MMAESPAELAAMLVQRAEEALSPRISLGLQPEEGEPEPGSEPGPEGEPGGVDGGPGGAGKPGEPAPKPVVRAGDRQVEYQPGAKNTPAAGTLVPERQAEAVREAIALIERETGKTVEEYVAEKIGMTFEKIISGIFYAEQLDSIALAIYQLEQGKGFIIGDMTGIGKGRQVAALLIYAMRSGRIPVFVTENSSLYTDMLGEFADLGYTDIKFAPTNVDRSTNGEFKDAKTGKVVNSVKILSNDNDTTRTHFSTMLKSFRNGEGLKAGDNVVYDVIATTYSQLTPRKKPDRKKGEAGVLSWRNGMMSKYAPDSIFILDESHTAGGTQSVNEMTPEAPFLLANQVRKIHPPVCRCCVLVGDVRQERGGPVPVFQHRPRRGVPDFACHAGGHRVRRTAAEADHLDLLHPGVSVDPP